MLRTVELVLAGHMERLSCDLQTMGRTPRQITIFAMYPLRNIKELVGLPVAWLHTNFDPQGVNHYLFHCYIWCSDRLEPGAERVDIKFEENQDA